MSSSLATRTKNRECPLGTPYFYSERWMEALDSPNFAPQAEYSSIRCNRPAAVGTNPPLATDESSSRATQLYIRLDNPSDLPQGRLLLCSIIGWGTASATIRYALFFYNTSVHYLTLNHLNMLKYMRYSCFVVTRQAKKPMQPLVASAFLIAR